MSYRRKAALADTYKPKSKNFLLPMLDVKLQHIGKDFDTKEEVNYLIGVYLISDKSQIVVILDNIDYEPLKMDIYKMQNNPYYVDSRFDDDNKEVCILFDIPKEYIDDYGLFKLGKYSRFSDKYKKLLESVYGMTRMNSFNPLTGLPNVSMYDALHPDKDKIKALAKSLDMESIDVEEVLSPPDIEKETYKTIEELKGLYEVRE